MSNTTKHIITATAAIIKMDPETRERTLLKILETNPAAVIKALMGNGVKFDELPGTLFKVVLGSFTNNKIALIRAFRDVTGAGLPESKAWSEGQPYNGLDSGVFKTGMAREEAEDLAGRITRAAAQNGNTIGVKVLRENEEYDYRNLVSWAVDIGKYAPEGV